MNANDLVIELHNLGRETNDIRIRKLADELSEIAKWHSDKGYELSTHEKQKEFSDKRNYHYTNAEGFYDVQNMSLDEIKRKNRE
jgi:hypothetical protein